MEGPKLPGYFKEPFTTYLAGMHSPIVVAVESHSDGYGIGHRMLKRDGTLVPINYASKRSIIKAVAKNVPEILLELIELQLHPSERARPLTETEIAEVRIALRRPRPRYFRLGLYQKPDA